MKRAPMPPRRTPLPRSGPLRQRSTRQAASDRVFAAARVERQRLAGDRCEGATPACSPGPHRGVLAHHTRRRKGQRDVHAVEHLRWLCAPAHEWVHGHVAAARALGLLTTTPREEQE